MIKRYIKMDTKQLSLEESPGSRTNPLNDGFGFEWNVS